MLSGSFRGALDRLGDIGAADRTPSEGAMLRSRGIRLAWLLGDIGPWDIGGAGAGACDMAAWDMAACERADVM